MDGWLLRASGGPIRRTNSVNPLRHGPRDPAPILAACETIYAALGQDTLFRVPGVADPMDAILDDHGFEAEGSTLTLFTDLANAPFRADAAVALQDAPDAAWVALRTEVNGESEEAGRVFHAMTDMIGLPRTFAALRAEDRMAAVAYGVIDRGLLVVESVATGAGLSRPRVGDAGGGDAIGLGDEARCRRGLPAGGGGQCPRPRGLSQARVRH